MATIVQSISGSECIGDSLSKINNNFSELAKFVAPDFTAANIASRVHSVNTTDKQIGRVVFDTTNNRLMVAAGSTDTSRWYVVDGSTFVTPA
jgi:hypothetical protein